MSLLHSCYHSCPEYKAIEFSWTSYFLLYKPLSECCFLLLVLNDEWHILLMVIPLSYYRKKLHSSATKSRISLLLYCILLFSTLGSYSNFLYNLPKNNQLVKFPWSSPSHLKCNPSRSANRLKFRFSRSNFQIVLKQSLLCKAYLPCKSSHSEEEVKSPVPH